MKKPLFKNILILAVVNMVREEEIDFSNDSIIIMHHLENIPGGVTLDVTAIDATAYPVLSSGWPIILETATGLYKPLPVTSGAFDALPGGHTWAGTLRASVLTTKALASIMVRGTVNAEAFKVSTKEQYNLATGLIIPAAQATAQPLIRFTKD